METASELRAEAERLRDLARDATDPNVAVALFELVAELEARARGLGNGA